MASSGPNSPGTLANDTAVGTVAWVNPGNVATSNDSYATCNLVYWQQSNYLKASNFNFSIPSGATINGIVVNIELGQYDTSGLHKDAVVKLVKGGAVSGTDHKVADYWPASDTVRTYGSSSDLWGLSWTDSDINASNFGVVLSVMTDSKMASSMMRVDHITITVYYTDGGGGGSTVKQSRALLGVGW